MNVRSRAYLGSRGRSGIPPVCALLAARNRYLCAQPMVTEMSGSAVTGRIAAFAPPVRRQGVTPAANDSSRGAGPFHPRARGADFPPPRSPAAARLSLLVGWRTARFQGVNEGSTEGGEFRSVGPACEDGLGARARSPGRYRRQRPARAVGSCGQYRTRPFRGSSGGLM